MHAIEILLTLNNCHRDTHRVRTSRSAAAMHEVASTYATERDRLTLAPDGSGWAYDRHTCEVVCLSGMYSEDETVYAVNREDGCGLPTSDLDPLSPNALTDLSGPHLSRADWDKMHIQWVRAMAKASTTDVGRDFYRRLLTKWRA